MRVLFTGSVPKCADHPDENEDAFAGASGGSKLALCDGASESFDSRRWARILAKKFVENSDLGKDWILSAIEEYSSTYEFESLPWSRQLAYKRGSFATLLAIEIRRAGSEIEVTAVGDSIAVLLDGDVLIDSFPFQSVEEFGDSPLLIGTSSECNKLLEATTLPANFRRTWDTSGLASPKVLCMTDALGEWAMRHVGALPQLWRDLSSMSSLETFEKLVLEARSGKCIRTDDTTLIVVLPTEDGDELPDPRAI